MHVLNKVSAKLINQGADIATQLAERSLPTPEVRGSIPIIGIYFNKYVPTALKDENKIKRGQEWPNFRIKRIDKSHNNKLSPFDLFQNVLLHLAPVSRRPPDGLFDIAPGGRVDLHEPILLRWLGPLQDGQIRTDDRAVPQLLRPHHDSRRQVKLNVNAFALDCSISRTCEQCDQIGRFFWTLGKFLKPLATINLPKSPTFLGNFCKGVNIYHFSSEIIFGNFYRHLAISSGHTACE